MGLFFGGFYKDGPGVDPNEPRKKGLFLYMDIVWNKLSKFFQMGLVYSLFSIPLIVLVYFASVFVFANPIASLQVTALETMEKAGVAASEMSAQLGTITFMLCAVTSVFFVMLWGSGPLSAAFSYVTREFTRGKYVWIWSDGKEKIKENLKQGFILLVIDLLVFIILPVAITFYSMLSKAQPEMEFISSLFIYILLLAVLIYTMMHPYMYQLMITFNSSFGEIFKKSLLLSIAHLPVNLLLTAISLFLIVFPTAFFGVTGTMIMILFSFTIGCALLRYPMEFYASRIIEKTFIKPARKKTHIEYEDSEADD